MGGGVVVHLGDEAARSAGLSLQARYSTWEGAPFDPAEGYAVSVHALG